jgi:hypothetical protein
MESMLDKQVKPEGWNNWDKVAMNQHPIMPNTKILVLVQILEESQMVTSTHR